jgi:hypothetical protein
MYAELLRGQGVPAMLRAAGAGRGALGGALVTVQVLVPGEALAHAREILAAVEDLSPAREEPNERKDGDIR